MSIAESRPFAGRPLQGGANVIAAAASLISGNVNEEVLRPGQRAADCPPTASHVAEAIAKTSSIGLACAALKAAGWRATIAGNRISVDEQVFAQYVGASADSECNAMWMIYGSADASPIWVTTGSAVPDNTFTNGGS